MSAIYPPFPVQGSDVTANEETRLRNLLLKKGAGTELKPLDVHFIRKLSAKKSAEESLDKKQKIIVTS